MILSSIFLGIFFLILFLLSIYYGHFDDFNTSKTRILIEEEKEPSIKKNNS